jgi:3-hydroxyacyl-CoA dehydrogenase
MGAGIAEVCARVGLDVVLVEIDEVAADRARDRVEASLDRAVERGKLDEACFCATRPFSGVSGPQLAILGRS